MAATCNRASLLLRIVCYFILVVVACSVRADSDQGPVSLPVHLPSPSFFVKQLGIDEFHQFINSSSVGIVYFQRKDSKRIQAFLREFEKSAQRLHAFAINLGKVDCNKHPVDKYCQDERSSHNAFGFRDGKEKIALPLDTLFDVDSIVSSALHLALIHNVPIIQSHRERIALENKCKRRFDIIFTYQRALGTYEHRVFMELAFTFLDKYVFALTTHELATQGLRRSNREVDRGDEEVPSADSATWALFCQEAGDVSDECTQSAYYGPVHLLDLIHFIQALDHPPWSLFDGLEERPFATPSHMHALYLFHDDSSETASVTSQADHLARTFRGSLSIVLVSRSTLGPEGAVALGLRSVDDIQASGMALRMRLEHGLHWIEKINSERQIAELLREWPHNDPPERSETEVETEQRDQLAELRQDDDVAEHVRVEQHFSSLPALTGNGLADAMKHQNTAVLFYVNWDPRSQVMLEVMTAVKKELTLSSDFPSDASLYRFNCFDWPEHCQTNNVSAYPTLRISRPTGVSTYGGLINRDSILSTLYLTWTPNLHILSSAEDVEAFSQGNLPPTYRKYGTDVVFLGLDSHDVSLGVLQVEMMAEDLRDRTSFGIIQDDKFASDLCCHFKAKRAPCVVVFKLRDSYQRSVPMSEDIPLEPNSIIQFWNNASLNIFDELTASNFPEYWRICHLRSGFLLIYFTPESITDDVLHSVSQIAIAGTFPQLVYSWMSTKAPLTVDLLKFYKLGAEEKSVVILDFDKKTYFSLEIRRLTVDDTVNQIDTWISDVVKGYVNYSSSLGDGTWKPLHPGFDYLRLIDEDMDREIDEHWHDRQDSQFEAGGTTSADNGKMYPKFRPLRVHRSSPDVRNTHLTSKQARVEL